MKANVKRFRRAADVLVALGAVALIAGFNGVKAEGQAGATGAMNLQQKRPRLGVLQNERYRHTRTGTEFAVPQGWSFVGDSESSDGGDSASIRDSLTGGVIAVWMINRADSLEASRSASVEDEYRHVVGMKIRMRFDQGLKNYWVAADSIQERPINGRMALTAMGEHSDPWGRAFQERLAWIYTDATRVFFHGTVPADDMPTFRDRFDLILSTAKVG